MTKSDRLKGPRGELDDDLNFDMPDFDFGEDASKSRKPADAIKKGIKTAAHQHFTSESTLKRLVNKSLPREYGEFFDTYTESRDNVKDAVQSVKDTMREPVNEFAKAVRDKLPQNFKRTRKFIDFVEERTQSYKTSKFNQSKEDDRAITASLEQMFAAQDEARQYERDQDEAKRNIEKTEELVRFKGHTAALNVIARSSDILAKNAVGITQNYQRKSLELQYRTVFGIRDTNEQLRLLIAQNRAQLDQIRHNTALPEAQKLQINERFANTFKNKFVESTLGKFTKGNNVFSAMTKQFTDSLKEMAEYAATGLQLGTTGMSMDFDLDNEDPVQRRRRQIAEGLTSWGLNAVSDYGGEKLKKGIRGNRKVNRAVNRGRSHLKNWMQNGDAEMREFALGGDMNEGTGKAMLRDLVSLLIPNRDLNRTLTTNNGAEFLRQPAVFDGAVKRSITEVMPGYLARILQELQIGRTGNHKVGLTHFDYDKGGFVSRNELLQKYSKQFSQGQEANKHLDKFVQEVSKGSEGMDKDVQERLRQSLLRARLSGSSMTPGRMTERGFWTGTGSKQDADVLSRAFSAYFDSPQAGKFSGSNKGLRARDKFIDAMVNAQEAIKDPRAGLQDAYTQGHGDILRQLGWISDDGQGGASINFDKMVQSMLGKDVGEFTADTPTHQNKRLGKRHRANSGNQSNNDEQWSYLASLLSANTKAVNSMSQQPRVAPADNKPVVDRLDQLIALGTSSLEALQQLASGGFFAGGQNTATPGAAHGSLKDRLMGWKNDFFSGGTDQDAPRGFWNRTVGENVTHLKQGFNKRFGQLRRLAGKGFNMGRKTAGIIADTAGDTLGKTRLFGARLYEDFKDGIPTIGDVYVGSEKIPRITIDGFKMGEYFDGKGNPIPTLLALADAADGVFDKTGKFIMSRAELEKSYVKANGKIFARVFVDRVRRAAARLGQGAARLFSFGNALRQRAQNAAGFGLRLATSMGKELFAPPRDVYVIGESTPRLLAHVMRLGGYLNMDGSVIERPTQIKGPVTDTNGEILISQADLLKGLVDANGQPFRTIVERVAGGIRKRAADTARIAHAAIKTARNIGAAIGKNANIFLQKGLGGFREGSASSGAGFTADGGYSNSLLEQIRDILDARLPGSGGFTARTSAARNEDGSNTNGNNPNAPGESAPTNRDYNGGENILNMAGNLAGKGIGALTGAFRRWRNKRKGLPAMTGMLGSGEPDNADLKDAVKDSQEKTTKEINALKKENKSLFKRMRDGYQGAKQRMMAGPVTGVGGKPVRGDTDGDGLRDNSWQDLKNKYRNINEPTKDLSDVPRPADMGTENTIDLLLRLLGGGGSALAGALGGLGDWLPGGEGKGRGKKGGRKAPAGKKGFFRRTGGKLLDLGKRAAGGVGRAVGGAAARVGGLGAIGRGLMTAGSFAAKRIALPALGGVAAILGAPWVGTALAVGGAAWGLKELYDMVGGSKKKQVEPFNKGNANLRAFRMAEYGVSIQDTGPQSVLSWLEDYLYPHVKVSDGKASIDEKKIDAGEIVTRFNIDMENEEQLARFSRWLENRFKPNFLKHAAAAKTANLASLKDTDKLKPSQELAFYRAVSSSSEGYDEVSNPFGTSNDLQITSSALKEMKEVLSKMLEEKAQKEAPAEKLAQATSKSDLVRKDVNAIMKSGMVQAEKGAAAGNKAFDAALDGMSQSNKLRGYQNDQSRDLSAMMGSSITYATPKVAPLPSRTVTALASVRYRLYGLVELQPSKVACLNALEAETQKYVEIKKDGSATFTGSLEKVFENTRSLFGVSAADPKACSDWKNWFEKRFLPLFTTYYAQACFHTGTNTLEAAITMLKPAQTEAVGNAMMAMAGQVMSVMTPPWPKYTLNSTTVEIKQYMQLLQEHSQSQKLEEERIKPAASADPMPKPVGPMLQAVYRPEPRQTSVYNAPKQTPPPVTLPDVEQDEKSNASGAGGASSATKDPAGAAKAPGIGALKRADGELFSGAGADAFLKLYGNARLDGANPEAVKLFRGMVEEYGKITGKSIQLNSGHRSYAEQAEAFRRTPGKAARPGGSLHEFGLAFDINSADADALEKLGLMRKYGFTRPVGGEPWHIEPAGIQANLAKYKKDASAAMMAVSYSPGRGGGGVGMTKGAFPMGRRDTQHALALFGASDSTISNEDNRTGSGNRSQETPQLTNRGGYAGTAAQIGQEVNTAQSLPDFESDAKNKTSTGLRQRGLDATTKPAGGGYADLKGGGSSREDMKQLVADAARQVGVDPQLAQTTVAVESGFKAGAAAEKSSAKGLYQFTKATWNDMVTKHGATYGIPADAKPTDPKANAIMGALYLKQNMQRVSNAGMPQTTLSAYLLHMLGPTGGQRFMNLAPDVIPAHAMADAAASNRPIFFDGKRPRSKQEIIDLLENKFTRANKDFGIDSSGQMTTVAQSGGQAANDKAMDGSNKPITPAAPVMQQALYKPAPEPVRPQTVNRPEAVTMMPSMIAPQLQRAGLRDARDHEVGSMGTQQRALLTSIEESNSVQNEQLLVQQKILEILTKKLGEQSTPSPSTEPADKPQPSGRTTPMPDRSPRRVPEPIIDTRRSA